MRFERYIPIELDPEEGKCGPAFFSVMLLDGGKQLLAAAPDEFVVWDAESRVCTYVEEIPDSCLDDELLFPLTAGPAQTFATSWARGEFALWSLASLERIRVFEGHHSHVYHVLFLDENEVVSCSGDSTLRRWRIASGECLQTREVHVAHRMADSRVSGRIAVGGLRVVELVERATLRSIAVHPLPFEPTPFNASVPTHQRRGGADALAWCHGEEQLLVAGDDFAIRRLDASRGQVLGRWLGHTADITDVAVLPGGRGFVSTGYDKSLRFWSFDEAECVETITFDDRLLGLCVSEGGRALVASRGVVYGVDAPRGLIADAGPRAGSQ